MAGLLIRWQLGCDQLTIISCFSASVKPCKFSRASRARRCQLLRTGAVLEVRILKKINDKSDSRRECDSMLRAF